MSFFFAWVPNGNSVFGVAHHVVDEDVFAFELEHQEGDFASLKIEVRNPRVGLLSRDLWAWLAWQKPDDSIVPLFHGRLVGIPEDMDQEIITLELIGRPANFEAQKKALATTLRVPPYWDPVFIDTEELQLLDSDTVLDARPQLWHFGRTDKVVSISHVLVPEDGVIVLNGADLFDLNVGIGNEPIKKVHLEATVSWGQFATGQIDLKGPLVAAFAAVGSSPPNVSTYTGGGTTGLENTWPRFGDSIGGGWSVSESRTLLLSGDALPESYITVEIDPSQIVPEEGDIDIEDWWATSFEGYDYWYQRALAAWIAEKIANPDPPPRFYEWVLHPTFKVTYETTRQRKEILSFDVEADIQDLLVDAEAKTTDIAVSSDTITDPIDPGAPIGNPNRRSYFNTARGKRSVDYLLCLARARMLFASRAVEVSFQTTFDIGVGFSCRKSVNLTADELPGGACEGKIIAYKLSLDGDSGELAADCTIGCAIGRGSTLVPAEGTPTYVNGYVNGYRFATDADLGALPGELTYKDFVIKPVDDNIDFANLTPAGIIGHTAASALLTFTGPGVADTTITVGARVYTLKAALTGAYQVKIGADLEETARNVADAINLAAGRVGVSYGAGTLANVQAHATVENGIVRATANVAGLAGNAIPVSTTSLAASWSGATMTDGDDGLTIQGGVSEQAAILGETYGSIKAAIKALNEHPTHVQLALKPVTGGPFEQSAEITVSDLMVPKQIDLEAAA